MMKVNSNPAALLSWDIDPDLFLLSPVDLHFSASFLMEFSRLRRRGFFHVPSLSKIFAPPTKPRMI
jgi:hypothetical protein